MHLAWFTGSFLPSVVAMQCGTKDFMICLHCQSDAVSSFPADVRMYVNAARTIAAPPLTPAPTIHLCMQCGAAEFSVPEKWRSAGWLRPLGAVAVQQGSARLETVLEV